MNNYSISTSIQVLERTPKTLYTLLHDLSDDWVLNNEGGESWNAWQVLSHLIFCEQQNFFTRIQVIRSGQGTLPVFDMSLQFTRTEGMLMTELLEKFEGLRKQNLAALQQPRLSDTDLQQTGIHPKLGSVSLKNVLSTWVVHDLTHIAQIVRIMAHQHKNEVGPFIEFLKIIN